VLYENLSAGYGWDGISVALLAGGHPIGVIFTGLLWGALDAGGQYMSRVTQVENSIVEIIKGTILFLVVARYIYVVVSQKMKKRRQAKLAEQGEA
jgi:simple sugar transport system permease protein